MRVRVPLMIQDPLTSRYEGMPLVESFYVDEEDFFLDGPVTKRVAVLDFAPETGELHPGAAFVPPSGRRTVGRYQIPELDDTFDIRSPQFMQVSVFATVLRTMDLYEEMDALGRPLVWAFDAPQLLLIPRAGQMANAYYERASHSLQFFYFTPDGGQRIYTSLSRDIVAHEAGHAILDGILPDLYHALTPQSLALHEAIADLTALMMALRSHNLRSFVLRQTGGHIRDSTAFSSVAEELGGALDRDGQAGYLRSLLNRRTLDPEDESVDELGRPNRVPRNAPHALSQVLCGALYATMIQLHEAFKRKYMEEDQVSEFSASGKALWVAAEQFKRMILRALDYLPPGEVSFADYGRAILAADKALYPEEDQARQWITAEFVQRRMVGSATELESWTNYSHRAVQDLDLRTLVESDWAAYAFANANRELLNIPEDIPFEVRPRLDVTKTYYDEAGKQKSREVILKVAWDVQEPNPMPRPFPPRRRITLGSMLAIDWDTHQIRALLTSDRSARQRQDRDALLRRLNAENVLWLARRAIGPDGRPLKRVIVAEATDRLMRVIGTARMLHMVREV